MVEYYAKGTELLCLMNMNPDLEPVPEPFRMQSSVVLRVTLTAYVDFIRMIPADVDSIRLTGDVNVTKHLARVNSPILYNCFLRDMSFAIAKELHFAEKYKRKATAMLPTSHTCSTMLNSTIDSIYEHECDTARTTLNEIIASYGFEIPNSISSVNEPSYRLAVYLLQQSANEGLQEYNFTYGIKGN